jgi:hypothetical protein
MKPRSGVRVALRESSPTSPRPLSSLMPAVDGGRRRLTSNRHLRTSATQRERHRIGDTVRIRLDESGVRHLRWRRALQRNANVGTIIDPRPREGYPIMRFHQRCG